jgi:hypothetical protein
VPRPSIFACGLFLRFGHEGGEREREINIRNKEKKKYLSAMNTSSPTAAAAATAMTTVSFIFYFFVFLIFNLPSSPKQPEEEQQKTKNHGHFFGSRHQLRYVT